MLDVGVYDDHIVFLDGESFVPDEKFPCPSRHVKQLGKMVRMLQANPVLAIGIRLVDIDQLGVQAGEQIRR
ncbi:hypothetical protein D3C81_1674550 [compost metagenome]